MLGREGNPAEHLAGILGAAAPGSVAAFLGGDGVIQHGDHQLSVPLQSNDGELSQCDKQSPLSAGKHQFLIKGGADSLRDLGSDGIAGAFAHVPDLGTQHHGIEHLYHGGGAVGGTQGTPVRTAKRGIASENVGPAVLTAQNSPLVEHSQSVEGRGAAGADYRVRQHTVVEGNVDAIVVPIKSHRLHESLLRYENSKGRINISVDTEILNSTAGIVPTNPIILEYIKEKYGFNVHTLYLAQVRAKYGIQVHEAHGRKGNCKRNPSECPKYKEEAIVEAFRHFNMID